MSELSNRIDFLLVKNHQRRVDIVRATGIGESTIRAWITKPNPSAEHLYKVAQYFGVSIEWLLTGKGEEELEKERALLRQIEEVQEPYKSLNYQERKLLDAFRSLDERDRNSILMMAQTLVKTK